LKKARNLAVASTLMLSGLSATQVAAEEQQELNAVVRSGDNLSLAKTDSPNLQIASVTTINGVMYGITKSSSSTIKNGFMPHNKVLDTLGINQPLTVLEVKNGYYRVIAPHIRGWMPVSDVTLRSTPVPFNELQAVANKNGVIVRNGYMPHNHQVGTLNLNEHVRLIDLKNGYYRVVGLKTRGWVHKSDLQVMPTGVYYGVTTNSNTAVKNGFSDSNNTIATLQSNQPLTVLETKNGYHRVIAPYTRGWIKTTSVQIQAEPVPYEKQNGESIAGGVTVRNGYMPHNHKVGTLSSGQKVEIIDIKNGFYRIVADHTRGWVHHNSIKITTNTDINEPSQPETPSQPEVIVKRDGIVNVSSLNVRTGPGTEYSKVGSVSFNDDVTILDEQKGWYEIEGNGVKGWASSTYIDDIPLVNNTYQYINLRKPSNVTATQINNYIASYENSTGKKSVFSGKGQTFINTARKYGLNELFFAAFAIHESAYGTSIIAKSKNNLFGLGAFDSAPYDSAYYFDTVEDNLNYEAAFIRHRYLSPAPNGSWWQYRGAYLGDKSGGVNVYYASDALWGSKIASHMEKILPYNPKDYENATPFSVGTPSYSIPNHTDTFPNGIVAVANSDLTLYLSKNGGKSQITIPKGETFVVSAKTNDYWLQIRYNGYTYWTTFSFSTYSNFMSIQNLIRIQVDETLNVRESPNTSSKIVSTLKNYTHVKGILNSDNKLTTSGSWYQIQTPDGKIGWVSSTYAKRVYP